MQLPDKKKGNEPNNKQEPCSPSSEIFPAERAKLGSCFRTDSTSHSDGHGGAAAPLAFTFLAPENAMQRCLCLASRSGYSIRTSALDAFHSQELELSSDLLVATAAAVERGWCDHEEQPVAQNAPEAECPHGRYQCQRE